MNLFFADFIFTFLQFANEFFVKWLFMTDFGVHFIDEALKLSVFLGEGFIYEDSLPFLCQKDVYVLFLVDGTVLLLRRVRFLFNLSAVLYIDSQFLAQDIIDISLLNISFKAQLIFQTVNFWIHQFWLIFHACCPFYFMLFLRQRDATFFYL